METNETCGCCESGEQLTPMDISNRPGLSALHYRVGTHGSFLATMLAQLSNWGLEMPLSPDQQASLDTQASTSRIFPLAGLTTRTADPAIGFLDAWAAIADVLTFYQERIATEGFLETATERRSLLELARLLGYQLRPGVSASTYLAYTLDKLDDTKKGVVLAAGTRAQSVPGPGELPQSFETSEPLWARPEWNSLQPRLSQPPYITPVNVNAAKTDTSQPGQYVEALYFQGLATNLRPNDRLLFVFGEEPSQGLQLVRRVESVDLQTKEVRTRVGLQNVVSTVAQLVTATTISEAIAMATGEATSVAYDGTPIGPDTNSGNGGENTVSVNNAPASTVSSDEFKTPFETLAGLLPALKVDPTVPPRNSLRLDRPINQIFNTKSDASPQLLTAFMPQLENAIYSAFANAAVTQSNSLQNLAALRTRAAVFGYNAPKKPLVDNKGQVVGTTEWLLGDSHVLSASLVGNNVFNAYVNNDTKAPNGQVRVTITEGGTITHSSEQSLPDPNPNPTPTPVTNLTGATITNRIDTPPGGKEPTPLVTITLQFSDITIILSQQINSSNTADTITVNVDGLTYTINKGQKAQLASPKVAGRIIEINWQGEEFSVTVQSPTSSPLDVLPLDSTYDTVTPGSWVIVERADKTTPLICRVVKVEPLAKAAYNISAKVTQLTLSQPWLEAQDTSLAVVRGTTVYLQSEKWLTADAAPAFESPTASKQPLLAPTPIDPIAEPIGGAEIELDSLIDGLDSGRWLIVTGERLDIKTSDAAAPATSGVLAGELVMLARVEQRYKQVRLNGVGEQIPLPGDKTHTFLELATPLAYSYKRDTVTVYGNVIKATHGETRLEVLGSGDGSKLLQTFALKQFPLTYVSAPTPAGIKSTLEVRVNRVLWHENPIMAAAGPNDRAYTTKTDNDNKTSVIFGNGEHGARLPTGIENVQTKYRNGIGKGGNVKANQISLLATRPLGVKAVINPLPATGGADRESLAQARRNVPLSVMTLDRLVSVQDYQDFTRTFAGIGKSSATRLSDGRRPVVFVTIAGLEDIPIAKTSDLWQNLYAALQSYGDPALAIQLLLRELSLIIISAGIKVLPDYLFEWVVPKVKAALLDAFSFEKRELGQPVIVSQVISTIQAVEGVAYCDLDTLDTIGESTTLADIKRITEVTTPQGSTLTSPPADIWLQMARPDPHPPNKILPAQIAYLTPDIQDSLILREIV